MKMMKRLFALTLALLLLTLTPIQAGTVYAIAIPEGMEDAVVAGLEAREEQISLSEYNVDLADLQSVYYEILDRHPELWYVERMYSYSYNSSGKATRLYPYYMEGDVVDELAAKADEIVSECIYPWMSDLEKALALHDYMLLHSEYDLTYSGYTAYDNLILGSSVCQGYAEAYTLLLGKVGISSKIVSSDPMNHAWNLVLIDGSWYHVDVTWDDPIADLKGRARHAHFMLSDAGITAEDHYGWTTDTVCGNTQYDSNSYWSGVDSAIVFLADRKSIIRYDGMGSVRIVLRDHSTGNETTLFENNKSRYEHDGGMWYTVTRGLSRDGDNIYFNDLSKVYSMPVTGGEVTTLCTVTELGGGHYIAGTYASNGKLYVIVQDADTGERTEKVVNLDTTHTHSYTKTVTEATCMFAGSIVYTCSCGDSYSETIPALEHAQVVDPGVAATCTAAGLTEGLHCSVCGTVMIAQESIPALGHSWDAGVTTQAPTAEVPGIRLYTCLTCGETRTETLEYTSGLQTSGDLDREKPTMQQIIDYWNNLPYAQDIFAEEPSVSAPYATGELDESYLNSGLAYLNYIRFVAGLPEAQLSDALNENAQYGAVLLAAIDTLTHYPSQPDDMDDDFYSRGYTATTSSNISMRSGYGIVNYLVSSLSGCLADSGSNNLETVGHRRWLLNPRLLNVGFGHAMSESGRHYVTTKVFDTSGKAVNYEFVSWPASGYVPTNLFEGGTPWSVTLNPNLYKKPVLADLTVTLTREADNAVWTFDASTGGPTNAMYPYLTVNNGGYGVSNCIIFSPGANQIEEFIGVYTVEITGLYAKNGDAKTLRYQVEFFDAGVCNHVFDYVTTEPTCTDYGYITRTCLRCGLSEMTELLIATGHTWDEGVIILEPTEESEGIRRHTCASCGLTNDVAIPKLEHVHSYTTEVVEPGCELLGYTIFTCDCGESYLDQFVEALGHDEVTDPGCAPTCTEVGWTEGSHCQRCGALLTVQEMIPELGHAWDEGNVTTEPTEEYPGVRTFTCTRCGQNRTEEIPMLEHTHKYAAQVTEATCTTDGFTTYTCSCGYSYTADYVDALGHQEVIDPAVSPTCTEEGLTEGKHCAVCAVVLVAQRIVPTTDHSWDDGVITTEPTEETEGVRTFTCVNCGQQKTEAIPALEHTHSYTAVVTAPTCEGTGFTTYTCSCGNSYDADYVPALGHTFGLWLIETESVLGVSQGKKYRQCECGQQEVATYSNPLIDVPNGKYFTKPIFWAYENGITKGKTATEFQRDAECTRKQIVTFLWRAAGQPEPKSMVNPFTDVKRGDQFEKAILWAYYEGITSGTGDGSTFSPENVCTRKQIVTFLWRFYGQPAPVNTEIKFTDVKNDRFAPAILWAAEQGITTGTGDGSTFSPENTCTRGQIVTFLYRAMVEAQQK